MTCRPSVECSSTPTSSCSCPDRVARARHPRLNEGGVSPMADPTLSDAGRGLLNRRRFLEHSGTGLGGIALASLLADGGLLAAEKDADRPPIRPAIRAENPLADRPPHFPARAKRVLVIFCSGACSQLES